MLRSWQICVRICHQLVGQTRIRFVGEILAIIAFIASYYVGKAIHSLGLQLSIWAMQAQIGMFMWSLAFITGLYLWIATIRWSNAILGMILVLLTPVYLPGLLILLGQLLIWSSFFPYFIGQSTLVLVGVLIPLSISVEYLWKQHCDLSAEARKRSKGRKAEADLNQIHSSTLLKRIASRIISLPFLTNLFFTLAIIFMNYTLLSVSIAVIPLVILYRSAHPSALSRSTYHRYLKKMLVNSGWTTSPAPLPGLPVELWEVIIEFSFDIPEYFGDDCQPKDLPYFLDHRRVISPSSWKLDPYRRLEQHRFRLRLVSRTWNNIVELNSKQWRRSLDSKNLSRYQRVDVTLPKNPKTRRSGYNEGLSFSSTPTLKILAIKELSSRINVVEQRISTLCHNPTEFLGNVKSLAYLASEARLSPSTISKLLSSFTSITVLILNSHRVEGALSLPQMHTLELSAEVYDLHDWKCPRLQHFSLLPGSKDGLLDEIIPNQFNSIRALMVLPLTAQLDTEFWLNYPKLQLFGCSDMILVNRPPSDHPLKHIYIKNDVYQMSPEHLSSILDCLGGGDRTLYITPPNFSRDGQRKWNQWCQFYERCQINGIAWRSILPNDDPDVAWLPLVRMGWVDRLERIAVSWALEINISASLAIICCVKDAAVVFRDLRLLFSAFVIYGLVHFTCSDILVSI